MALRAKLDDLIEIFGMKTKCDFIVQDLTQAYKCSVCGVKLVAQQAPAQLLQDLETQGITVGLGSTQVSGMKNNVIGLGSRPMGYMLGWARIIKREKSSFLRTGSWVACLGHHWENSC